MTCSTSLLEHLSDSVTLACSNKYQHDILHASVTYE